MKYFTEEWCFGKIKDSEIRRISKNYLAYLDEIYKKLSFPVKLLAKQINLHDGIIEEFKYYQKSAMLILKGSFGDLQVGYFSLQLKYLGIIDLNLNQLSSLCKEKKVEILRNEIELLPNDCYTHRIYFSVKKELEITFQNLEIEITCLDKKNHSRSCQLTLIEG